MLARFWFWFRNSRIPNCHGDWQSSRESDPHPTGHTQEPQLDITSITHCRKVRIFAVFLAECDGLLFFICFLFAVIYHVKVYQAVFSSRVINMLIHRIWLKDGNFTTPSNRSWAALKLCSCHILWSKHVNGGLLKYEDDNYTGSAELVYIIHQ